MLKIKFQILMLLFKKSDYATEISWIKNNYVTNAALTSELNKFKKSTYCS